MSPGRPQADGGGTDPAASEALYVFRVAFRLDPSEAGLQAEPNRFETTVYRSADAPGDPGWLFFRDNCWRGELSAPATVAVDAEDAFGVAVEHVEFRELRTSPDYMERLREAIREHPEEFGPETVDGVLSAHLGSSIHVVE